MLSKWHVVHMMAMLVHTMAMLVRKTAMLVHKMAMLVQKLLIKELVMKVHSSGRWVDIQVNQLLEVLVDGLVNRMVANLQYTLNHYIS